MWKSVSIISTFFSRRRLSVGEDPGAAKGQHPAQQGHPGTGQIFGSTVNRNSFYLIKDSAAYHLNQRGWITEIWRAQEIAIHRFWPKKNMILRPFILFFLAALAHFWKYYFFSYVRRSSTHRACSTTSPRCRASSSSTTTNAPLDELRSEHFSRLISCVFVTCSLQ